MKCLWIALIYICGVLYANEGEPSVFEGFLDDILHDGEEHFHDEHQPKHETDQLTKQVTSDEQNSLPIPKDPNLSISPGEQDRASAPPVEQQTQPEQPTPAPITPPAQPIPTPVARPQLLPQEPMDDSKTSPPAIPVPVPVPVPVVTPDPVVPNPNPNPNAIPIPPGADANAVVPDKNGVPLDLSLDLSSGRTAPSRRCLPRNPSLNSFLVPTLESLHQFVLLRLLPIQLEHHFLFHTGIDHIGIDRADPLLLVLVRPRHNFGHEEIYNAIIDSWFIDKAGGVMEFDCSHQMTKMKVEELKTNITRQLIRCPESVFLFRYMELANYSDPILDFIHDVSSMSTELDGGLKISGSSAIFIMEVVIGSSTAPNYPSTFEAGRLLFEEATKPYHHGKGQWDLFGLMQHQQRILKTPSLQKVFRKWIATQTRLQLFWISDLSHETKLSIYRSHVSEHMQRLSQKNAYYDELIEISIAEEVELEHVSLLSPHHVMQGNGELHEVRWGILDLLEGVTEARMKEAVESCRPLYETGTRDFQMVVRNKALKCERFVVDTS